MAQSTILQIIKSVAPRCGVLAPTTAVGSNDLQIQEMLALANEEGKDLAKRISWQVLVNEVTFQSFAGADQGMISGLRIPSNPASGVIVPATAGFAYILNGTIFNRTSRYGMGGPVAPDSWQSYQAAGIATGYYSVYRLRGNHLLLYPAPAGTTATLAFEYVSENWVSNAAGDTTQTDFLKDDDFPLLDSRLIELGLKWRWREAKGLAYAEQFNTYERAVVDAMTREKTASVVSMDACRDEMEPMVAVPKGNWPL